MNIDTIQTFLGTTAIDLLMKIGAALIFWIVGRWLISKVVHLIQAGMNWDPVTRATEFYWVQTQPLEFGLLALWMIVVLAVGRGLFVRKEV